MGDRSFLGSTELLKSKNGLSPRQALLREGQFELVVVKDGKVIARSHDGLSHQELINRQLGGNLPDGASVGTAGKLNGEIIVLPSTNFPNNKPGLPDIETLQGLFN